MDLDRLLGHLDAPQAIADAGRRMVGSLATMRRSVCC